MDLGVVSRLLLLRQTLFGLTWLISGALLPFIQARGVHFSLRSSILLLLAFLAARFSGMCFNNYFDKDFDARNPRTRQRPLPLGEISDQLVLMQGIVFLAIFLVSAWAINFACGYLSIGVSALIFFYSLTKRITPLCHFVLGSVHFFAPICAWAAITGEISFTPVLFGLSLLFTIAASDILYACQDIEFDRKVGLYSIPSVLGADKARTCACVVHALSVLSLWLESFILGSTMFFIATTVVAGVYVFYHKKLLANEISHQEAFSRINTLSGLIILMFVVGDVWRVMW